MKVTWLNSIGTRPIRRERRRHPRISLGLPLDYRIADIPHHLGGIALNAGEGGLFAHCLRDIPLGAKLNVNVLFPEGYGLCNLEASVEVVRKERRQRGQPGYQYGLKLTKIDYEDFLKLRHMLRCALIGAYELGGCKTTE